ncbi:MarR family winged helix-turn-helix transcriptional regulator [Fulvivirgaceae bacterium BMA10]|uniref:MarR family winged helix-turn-helix transcriptional regulator n=1 Tax=Splendidivirga corallicola TaxID=3051826 RepID=A0ABT8KMM7_9BACT|nr:MarR family winged helix-turn-helix transcriptional regulator [Fulvivirgaceae bacterium BMA10]
MATIDEEMKTTFANEKHRFISNVVYTGNWLRNRFADFLKPFRLSPQQFNILRILRGAKDWVNMNDIKNRMVEKSPNTTRLCDKLVEKMLIERRRSEEDRRVVYLKISNQGLQLLANIDVQDDKGYTSFLDNVTDEEAKLVSKILDKLRG